MLGAVLDSVGVSRIFYLPGIRQHTTPIHVIPNGAYGWAVFDAQEVGRINSGKYAVCLGWHTNGESIKEAWIQMTNEPSEEQNLILPNFVELPDQIQIYTEATSVPLPLWVPTLTAAENEVGSRTVYGLSDPIASLQLIISLKQKPLLVMRFEQGGDIEVTMPLTVMVNDPGQLTRYWNSVVVTLRPRGVTLTTLWGVNRG